MSKLYYEKKVQLTSEMFNDQNQLTQQAILNLFQMVAGEHATQLNIDYRQLNKRNLMWVVVRNRHHIIQHPKVNDIVIISTWPHKANRIEYDREYRIKSLNNDCLIIGDSKWCIVDKSTRKIACIKDILVEGDFFEQKNFDTPLKSIQNKDFSNRNIVFQFQVNSSQIDVNNHLNNTEYAFMIEQCLQSKKISIQDFEINYVKETKLNEILEFKIIEENQIIYIEGYVNLQLRVRAKVGI